MPTCSRCSEPAILWQRYSGAHLCARHLRRSVEQRVTRELARQPLPRGSVVACAVSGGKDSIAALRLAHRYLAPARIEIRALTVDEGIAGYRAEGIEVAARACRELGVEHEVVRYEETFGTTTDALAAQGSEGAAPCSPCGVFRRTALNRAARAMGACRLLTGHNLDDMAQTVLMNVLRGDIARLARLGPHEEPLAGMVPRLLPLRMVPEREVALYAHVQGWEVHGGECPYAVLGQRRNVRDTLLGLEEREPGTRHALVAGLEKLAPILRESGTLVRGMRPCAECGDPTSGEHCRACTMASGARTA